MWTSDHVLPKAWQSIHLKKKSVRRLRTYTYMTDTTGEASNIEISGIYWLSRRSAGIWRMDVLRNPTTKKKTPHSRMAVFRWNSWSCDIVSCSCTPAETCLLFGHRRPGPGSWTPWTVCSCWRTWAWCSPGCLEPRAWTSSPSAGTDTARPACFPTYNPGAWASCPRTRSSAYRRWRPWHREPGPQPAAASPSPLRLPGTWSSPPHDRSPLPWRLPRYCTIIWY